MCAIKHRFLHKKSTQASAFLPFACVLRVMLSFFCAAAYTILYICARGSALFYYDVFGRHLVFEDAPAGFELHFREVEAALLEGYALALCFELRAAVFVPLGHGEVFTRNGVEIFLFGHQDLLFLLAERCHGKAVGHVAHAHYLNGYHAGTHHIDLASGRHREVHDAATTERTAVGDFHHHLLAVLLIAHFEQRAERQRAVGAGEAILVVARTVAREASVEFVAIIGCVAVQTLRTGGKYCEKCDYCCKDKNRL